MGEQKKLKIAIATHQMVMGGIEKSLIELSRVLLRQGFEVTVYVDAMGGELYNSLPSEVKVVGIFEHCQSTAVILKKAFKRKNTKAMLAVLFSWINNRWGRDPVKGWKANADYLDTIDEIYDYAFAYAAPVAFSVIFVNQVLRAKKKYAWIHNDCQQLSLDIRKYRDLFEKFDKIFCVSKMAKESFLERLPEYESKTEVFYNIINHEEILKSADEPVDLFSFSGTKILTVGRICSEKGQDIIPAICKRVRNMGYDIRWYCVGEGEDRSLVEKKIRELDVAKEVVLLGSKRNPYPYFKAADIYVQPSRHEGFGITLSEAKVFGLPIVTTDFDGASEQIEDGETGLIVHFDEEEICTALVKLLENVEIQDTLRNNLKNDRKSCISDISMLVDEDSE